ncbi:MAG: hypothetical protein NZ742_02560 [Acidobacteria bacterium]|nr:hypothetical protein [Acidobacteriota bacterium]MDW7983398.1 hypothetical protein [Acidobacteriota bacterium]
MEYADRRPTHGFSDAPSSSISLLSPSPRVTILRLILHRPARAAR